MRHPLHWVLPLLVLGFLLVQVTTYYACVVDDAKAREVLTHEGYTELQLGGYSWDGCPRGDSIRRNFQARSPSGETIQGVICCFGTWSLSCDVRH